MWCIKKAYFIPAVFCPVLSLTLSLPLLACDATQKIALNIHTIFDEQQQQINWLHKLANRLHIDTQAVTLENELAFLSPCETDPQVLYEAERYLRSRKFLRDAKVILTNAKDSPRIHVDTWDTWSLMPIIDFGRKGGKNSFEIGIKDRNLLGLGVDTELAYFSDPQRAGYKVDTEFPLYMNDNMYARIRLIDSPDGYQRAVSLSKPMVSVSTQWGGNLGINREDRVDTIFQNNNSEYLFRHQIEYKQADISWKYFSWPDNTLRLVAGITQDEHRFSDSQNDYLPRDRLFTYPWVGIEWLQDEFMTLQNLHLIEHKEDINLGWHLRANLGVNLNGQTHENALLWELSVNKGMALGFDTLVLSELQFEGFSAGSNGQSSSKGHLRTEVIHRMNPGWAWYGSGTWQFSRNPLLDDPMSLGGDTGMRGFPIQYRHAEQALLLSTELRHYPQINLFRLFELGGAVFYDVGQSYGDSRFINADSDVLQSVGIGARFYSTHSSEQQVIHIDLVHPFSTHADVSNFEIRLEVKHAF